MLLAQHVVAAPVNAYGATDLEAFTPNSSA
jgi:hypothetical protein